MRILFVQFGDYREGYIDLRSSGKEKYYAQRHSVEFVTDLARKNEYVGVLCVNAGEPYDEMLENKVHAIGVRLYGGLSKRALLDIISKIGPTHIILRTPVLEILRWAKRSSVRILPDLADSFETRDLKSRFRFWTLARALNDDSIIFVGNHNIPSCLSLRNIGVDSEKILPWDWPHNMSPRDVNPKSKPSPPYRLLFVGSVQRTKGIAECVEALAILCREGLNCTLDVLGDGQDFETMKELAINLGVQDLVSFRGRVPHDEVLREVRDHDVALIPSWHEYPEGLPMTIYEALAARTPLVISDHPMFVDRLRNEVSALQFSAGSSASLAAALNKLLTAEGLYERLSRNSDLAWDGIQVSLDRSTMVSRWLSAKPEDFDWLSQRNLPSELAK